MCQLSWASYLMTGRCLVGSRSAYRSGNSTPTYLTAKKHRRVVVSAQHMPRNLDSYTIILSRMIASRRSLEPPYEGGLRCPGSHRHFNLDVWGTLNCIFLAPIKPFFPEDSAGRKKDAQRVRFDLHQTNWASHTSGCSLPHFSLRWSAVAKQAIWVTNAGNCEYSGKSWPKNSI